MKKIFSFFGNNFYYSKWKDRSAEQKYSHTKIFPKNTYSPWVNDEEFQKIFSQISIKHTLVDQYRCYELWSIASNLRKLEGDIIEVGVWRGGSGAILAKAAGEYSTVYLCDTFEGVVKAGEKDYVYKGGEHSDTAIEIVEELTRQLKISNVVIVKGIFPEESENEVRSKKFKICHIDVDVYDSAKDVFQWVWPKLVRGGIVVFDDYGFAACEGITTLVNEIVHSQNDAIFFYNLNGHGIIIKIA